MTTAHEPHGGPGVHLSADDLSALAEGAQPVAEGASEHILECARCRDEVDAIAQLLAAFETLEPPQLPQDVAIRIDAALAREAAARASSSPAATSASGSGSAAGGASGGRRRLRFSRGFAWGLASLALVAGGVTLAVNLVSSSAPMSGSAASGASAVNPDASFNSGARAEGQLSSPGLIAPGSPLAIWVRQVLAVQHQDAQINSPCLADPALGGDRPLRVVDGTYKGVSATLVVLANDSDSKTVRAIVYAQPCAASSYQVLAQGIVAK